MEHLEKAVRLARGQRMRLAATVVAGAVALSACSSGGKSAGGTGNNKTSGEPPASAVDTALHNLGQQSSLSTTISLGLTQAQIEQLKDSNGRAPTPTQAKALSSGSIFFTVATGGGEALASTQAATDKNNMVDFGLNLAGGTPVELRVVQGSIYLHVQLGQLLQDVGQDTGPATKVQSALPQIEQYVPGISALGQGKWVEISRQSLQQLQPLLKQLEQKAQAQSGSSAPANTTQERNAILKLVADLENDLKTNTTFTNEGNQSGRTEYGAAVNVTAFAQAAIPVLKSDLAAIPQFGSQVASQLNQAGSQIPPNLNATSNVFVQNNKLNEVDVDLAQFAKTNKPPFPVPLKFVFGQPGPVSAPAGATQLDLSKLPTLLQGLMGSLGGSSSNG